MFNLLLALKAVHGNVFGCFIFYNFTDRELVSKILYSNLAILLKKPLTEVLFLLS